jgi:hypothetical protein
LKGVADGLVQLGFTHVSYHFTSRGNKIALTYELEDAPAYPVEFDNFPWFTDEELSDAIRAAVPFFDGSAPSDGPVLDQIAELISKMLAGHGITGDIHHIFMAEPASNEMMVQFRLEGPQLTIGSIEYSDPLAQNAEQLHDRNADLIGEPYSRYAIDVFETEQVRPLYLPSGHLQIHFGAPVIRLTGDPRQPLPSNLNLVLPIDPGPAYQIFTLSASGNTALDGETIAKLVNFKAGDVANGIALTEAWQRIEHEYKHRGYLDVQIDPQPLFDDTAQTVTYHLAVNEGPQYHVRDLILTGLSQEAQNALRLRWELRRGAVADGSYVDEMLAKLAKPSAEMFGDIPLHYTKLTHWLRPDPETRTLDILLDFQ